jgi:hypothetical protein
MILARHPHLNGLPDNELGTKVRAKYADLKFIGYWAWPKTAHTEASVGMPDPHDFVDEKWDPVQRNAVIRHLQAGETFESWRGWSWCRFKCGDQKMGSQCLTDGTYVWPQGFVHYIEHHAVRPPQEFIDHVLGV